ncbi:MAG: tetratricopeptide repeat protein [Candidatus Krumholzibacteriota bacterium]|nr:tetratricopeptide repeat protein [Candidatus Krumholzibacteriota bacterium]
MRTATMISAICLVFFLSCSSTRQLRTGKVYEKVITHKVGADDTWGSIAESYYGDRDRAEQLAGYNGAGDLAPPENGSGVKIPMSRSDLAQFDRRLEAVRKYNDGIGLVSEGRFREAVGIFQEALRINPSFPDASFNLAVTYQRLSLYKDAAEVLETLVTREKGNPEYFYALGASYFHMKDYVKAKRSFQDALVIDGVHLKSLFSLAVVYEKSGDYQDAEKCWEKYIGASEEGQWMEEAKSRLQSLRDMR